MKCQKIFCQPFKKKIVQKLNDKQNFTAGNQSIKLKTILVFEIEQHLF